MMAGGKDASLRRAQDASTARVVSRRAMPHATPSLTYEPQRLLECMVFHVCRFSCFRTTTTSPLIVAPSPALLHVPPSAAATATTVAHLPLPLSPSPAPASPNQGSLLHGRAAGMGAVAPVGSSSMRSPLSLPAIATRYSLLVPAPAAPGHLKFS